MIQFSYISEPAQINSPAPFSDADVLVIAKETSYHNNRKAPLYCFLL